LKHANLRFAVPKLEILRISEYKSNYLTDLIQLFYEVVHRVNAEDYTKEQLDSA